MHLRATTSDNNDSTTSANQDEDECSGPDMIDESDSQDEGEISNDEEADPNVPSGRGEGQGRESTSLAMSRMKQIIDRRGYLDAKGLERIMNDMAVDQGDVAVAPMGRAFGNDGYPKRNAGGGDRPRKRKPDPAKGKGRARVKFLVNTNANRAQSDSDVTIYRTAVRDKTNGKRGSSSSEEMNLNFSDEMQDVTDHDASYNSLPDHFITGIRQHYAGQQKRRRSADPEMSRGRGSDSEDDDRGMAHCSKDPGPRYERDDRQTRATPEERAEQLIREAEAGKARIYGTPGKELDLDHNQFLHSAMVDESYMLVATHLEDTITQRIEQGQYVDFARLLPRDRVLEQEGPEYKMVIKGGQSYYVPVSEGATISNFNRWEQAFRVFSTIYTRVHPKRASELIQYNHIIHSISLSYTWENVYLYDKDFRVHMGQHPNRSWGVILQMSWSFRLQDKIRRNDSTFSPTSYAGNNSYSRNGKPSKGSNFDKVEPCRRYNRGKCTYGTSCKYEHKCLLCFKFGHPLTRCRRIVGDKDKPSSAASGGGDDFARDSKAIK